MARTSGAMFDWHVFFGRVRSEKRDLWSRYPVELGPELIVTPHLFDWPATASWRGRHGQDVYTCAAAPEVAVFCARGEDHVRWLTEEVLPEVARRVRHVCLVEPEQDRFRFAPFEANASLPIQALGSRLRDLWGDPELDVSPFERLSHADGDDHAMFFRTPVADPDALRDLEEHPIRLWEALFWRGYTYRYELVAGEVPLVGDLGSPVAAARTAAQLATDAQALVREPIRGESDWARCGPFRWCVRGSRVELRVRLAPADVRVAFMPQERLPGSDALPSILGVLLAGGDNGKTELWDGWTWATAILESSREAEALASELAEVVANWTGAPTALTDRRTDGTDDPDGWYFDAYDRYLRVSVPFRRRDLLPWRVASGAFSDR
jgi:hypothetical protein